MTPSWQIAPTELASVIKTLQKIDDLDRLQRISKGLPKARSWREVLEIV